MKTNYNVMIGAGEGPVYVPAKYLNRHGLIAGATGTGKSVSLMGLAESFSRIGVASFVTDVKGDLSGLGAASTGDAAAALPGWRAEGSPLALYDVFCERGGTFGTTIRAMGAPLVSRAMALSDAQSGVLEIAFAVADDFGLRLHTLADLRGVLTICADRVKTTTTAHGDVNAEIVRSRYGLVTDSSVAGIGRAILRLERAGGTSFFGHKPFDVSRLMQTDPLGRGVISMLDCVRLIREPRLYAAVLLALLDAFAAQLPEIGDTEKPKIALFFDEAHLIFSDCPPELLRTIDQTVRLIRSKGVGIFFASQSPSDLPDSISRQLHLRVQHALRSVTPADANTVRAAAMSMPAAVGFRAADVIGTLGKGEALVSFMDETGTLTPCQRVKMALPRCRLSPLSDEERKAFIPVPTITGRRSAVMRGELEDTARTEDVTPAMRNTGDTEGARAENRKAWVYVSTAAAGVLATIPWAMWVAPAGDILPAVAMFFIYAIPFGASMGAIAGIVKGKELRG